jgi:hypothetical protein
LAARCEIIVETTCPEGARCTLEPPGRLGELEVLQVVEAPGGRSRHMAWRLVAIAFEPGALTVPPVSVRVLRTGDGVASLAVTAPAAIDVPSPPAAPDDELRAAAGPIDPGPDWRVIAASVIGGLAVLAAAWVARQSRRRRRPTPMAVAVAPTLGQVIERIRALERAPAASSDEVLAVYRRLSDELRGFAASALSVPAEALTSRELVRVIRAMPQGAAHAPRGRALLEGIDRVKFGGERPDATGRAGAVAGAIDLVRAMGRPHGQAQGRNAGVA